MTEPAPPDRRPESRPDWGALLFPQEPKSRGWRAFLFPSEPESRARHVLFTGLVALGVLGLAGLAMQWELLTPERDRLSYEAYLSWHSLHVWLVVAALIVPLSLGALGAHALRHVLDCQDTAYPRLAAVSAWLYLAGVVALATGIAMPASAPVEGGSVLDLHSLRHVAPGLALVSAAVFVFAIDIVASCLVGSASPGQFLRSPTLIGLFVGALYGAVMAASLLYLVFTAAGAEAPELYDPRLGGDPLLLAPFLKPIVAPLAYLAVVPAVGATVDTLLCLALRDRPSPSLAASILAGGAAGGLVLALWVGFPPYDDIHLHDTWIGVAGHHALFGGVGLLGILAGLFRADPDALGRLERALANGASTLAALGLIGLVLAGASLGAQGMPRRFVDYPDTMQADHVLAAVGGLAYGLGVAALFLLLISRRWRGGQLVPPSFGSSS